MAVSPGCYMWIVWDGYFRAWAGIEHLTVLMNMAFPKCSAVSKLVHCSNVHCTVVQLQLRLCAVIARCIFVFVFLCVFAFIFVCVFAFIFVCVVHCSAVQLKLWLCCHSLLHPDLNFLTTASDARKLFEPCRPVLKWKYIFCKKMRFDKSYFPSYQKRREGMMEVLMPISIE